MASMSDKLTASTAAAAIFGGVAFHVHHPACDGPPDLVTAGCRHEAHPIHENDERAPAVSQVAATGNASRNVIVGVPSGSISVGSEAPAVG